MVIVQCCFNRSIDKGYRQRLYVLAFNSHWPYQMVLSNGLIEWSYRMVLSNGLIIWSYHMVLSYGLIEWSYPMVLSNGLIKWLYQMVLSNGLIKWSYRMDFHLITRFSLCHSFLHISR